MSSAIEPLGGNERYTNANIIIIEVLYTKVCYSLTHWPHVFSTENPVLMCMLPW